MKQPSLNYNWVVSLDVGWNVGLGGMHHIHVHIKQHDSPAGLIKGHIFFRCFGRRFQVSL